MGELESDYIEDRTGDLSSRGWALPEVESYDDALEEMEEAEHKGKRWKNIESLIANACEHEMERSEDEVNGLREQMSEQDYAAAEEQITQWYDDWVSA
jgi:hypothetical protein